MNMSQKVIIKRKTLNSQSEGIIHCEMLLFHVVQKSIFTDLNNSGSKSRSTIEQEAILSHLGQHVLTGKLPGKLQYEDRSEIEGLWQRVNSY